MNDNRNVRRACRLAATDRDVRQAPAGIPMDGPPRHPMIFNAWRPDSDREA